MPHLGKLVRLLAVRLTGFDHCDGYVIGIDGGIGEFDVFFWA